MVNERPQRESEESERSSRKNGVGISAWSQAANSSDNSMQTKPQSTRQSRGRSASIATCAAAEKLPLKTRSSMDARSPRRSSVTFNLHAKDFKTQRRLSVPQEAILMVPKPILKREGPPCSDMALGQRGATSGDSLPSSLSAALGGPLPMASAPRRLSLQAAKCSSEFASVLLELRTESHWRQLCEVRPRVQNEAPEGGICNAF